MDALPKVYVADGDADVRDSLAALLSVCGFGVEGYASAEDLLAAANLANAGCLVSEVQLPGMSGIELLEHLRGCGVDIPVVLLASRGDVPLAVRALRAGAADFLEKPIVDAVLVRRIREAMAERAGRGPGRERLVGGRVLPVSRRARERYRLDGELFSSAGSLRLDELRRVHEAAHVLNERRAAASRPPFSAGELNAVALAVEFVERFLDGYRLEKDPGVFLRALGWLYKRFGKGAVDRVLLRYVELFASPETPAPATVEALGHPDAVLERLLVIWWLNLNPALLPFRDLFDDTDLESAASYRAMMSALDDFFAGEPAADPTGRSLVEVLRSSAEGEDLAGQLAGLAEVQERMAGSLVDRLRVGLDLLAEERGPSFEGAPAAPAPRPVVAGPGPPAPPRDEPPWMRDAVILAKHLYVWLDQLSRSYEREIRRLDEIPEAELARLARQGFTVLWLIGFWERSAASRRLQQIEHGDGVMASAYALAGYRVAAGLGGDEALEALTERAGRHGLRLACDVVPNHMGIDSPWVLEHPDWFISLDESPFPSYSFTGEDLSPVAGVGIYLEDHYYDRSDAAVVFQRVDRATGEERFLYHGNDGTGLPWNDTAQLDYLNPEVRENLVRVLLELARRFPVIRIDAAMTLVRRHFQRLWHPPPGGGGAVPSRAGRALAPDELERRMGGELWRQVVDRLAEEAPGVLLVAEGFWWMEEFFLRDLRMHRVYNSAFMHQLRDRENAFFRHTVKNALQADPALLGRFLNYLSNPDEPSAAEQLGRGERYFALATLLATLPGTPLFAHGQLEGLTEKYGMEYARPRLDEEADPELVRRHEREIAPLLRQRSLFSSPEKFRLFDALTGGKIAEDVFAFTNGDGERRALVVVHNGEGTVRCRLHRAAPHRGAEGRLVGGEPLGEALGIGPDGRVALFDSTRGEKVEMGRRELFDVGLELELGPWQRHVFLRQDPRHAPDEGPAG